MIKTDDKIMDKFPLNGDNDNGAAITYRRQVVLISEDSWAPPTDIFETASSIIIFMEIGGLRADDVSLHYDQGILTIEGKRPEQARRLSEKIIYVHKKELDYGKFKVRMNINFRVVYDKIKAHYDEGILRIQLPKDTHKNAPSKIKIDIVSGDS